MLARPGPATADGPAGATLVDVEAPIVSHLRALQYQPPVAAYGAREAPPPPRGTRRVEPAPEAARTGTDELRWRERRRRWADGAAPDEADGSEEGADDGGGPLGHAIDLRA